MAEAANIGNHLAQFGARATALTSGQAQWLSKAQNQAAERLRVVGVPARRDEYWKYTDPNGILNFCPQATKNKYKMPSLVDNDAIDILSNGHGFDLSNNGNGIAQGVTIHNLLDAAAAESLAACELYGKLESQSHGIIPRGMATINTRHADRGLVIECQARSHAKIQLLMDCAQAKSSGSMIHHVIDVRPGAQLLLTEIGYDAALVNIVYEIQVGEGASVQLVRAAKGNGQASAHMCSIFADVEAGGQFDSFALSAWRPWARDECVVRLKGDQANTNLAGASLGKADCHHDDTVLVIHEGQNCESRQVFKKVLHQSAKGVFQGKILVKKNAQKTDGYQISQGLLLDDDAQFLAKPELEIYADDVACSHGSTSGGVDETQMFYLRSRGIAKKEAETLLSMAFLADAINEVRDEQVKSCLDDLAKEWFSRGD